MTNKYIAIAIQILGWIIILYQTVSFIVEAIMWPVPWEAMYFNFFNYLPFIFTGMVLVWLGKRLNTNNAKAEEDQNKPNNQSTAKGTKTFGWIIVFLASIFTLLGFMITNDAEGQAYRPLLVIPPIIGVVVGLFIVWTGMRIQKNTNE